MINERNINIRLIITEEIPVTIDGCCMKLDGPDNYMMLINGGQSDHTQLLAFLHECLHIWHRDHDSNEPVTKIEEKRHAELKEILRNCL